MGRALVPCDPSRNVAEVERLGWKLKPNQFVVPSATEGSHKKLHGDGLDTELAELDQLTSLMKALELPSAV